MNDLLHFRNIELTRAMSSTAAVKAQSEGGWVANTKRGTAFYFAPVGKFLSKI